MPNNETIERLQQIRERLTKATPGPWKLNEHYGQIEVAGNSEMLICFSPVFRNHGTFAANADLVVNAPSDIEFLLSSLSEMRTVALREAAEIDLGADVQGITDWGKGYKQAVRDYAAAILGRIDK